MIGHSKEEVKDILIKAAQECFARYGFRKTTMNDIAHAAGKAKSSLYYYFKSKTDIMAAIVDYEVKILRAEISSVIDKEKDPKKKLHVYIVSSLTAVVKKANYYNFLKSDYIEQYASLEKIREQYDRDDKNILKGIFQYGVDQGVFIVKDIDAFAASFVIVLKGFELQWMEEKNLQKLEKYTRALLDTIFYGIVKR